MTKTRREAHHERARASRERRLVLALVALSMLIGSGIPGVGAQSLEEDPVPVDEGPDSSVVVPDPIAAPGDSAAVVTPPGDAPGETPDPIPESTVGDDAGASDGFGPPTPLRPRRYLGVWRFTDPSQPGGLLGAVSSSRINMRTYFDQGYADATVVDTLEYSAFIPDRWRLGGGDVVTSSYDVDLDSGTVTRTRSIQGREFGVAETYDASAFSRDRLDVSFRQGWRATADHLRTVDRDGETGGSGLLDLELPALPSALQPIFGDGKSTLSVSGSERISFSGTSTWFPYRNTQGLSSSQSKFPDLDMKQDLFLKLTGSIGDKVFVDIDQNSNAQSSLENRIKIRYEGYDDEIIRRVNLGNTSLSLPGTRYVSYGGVHEGLFGVSAEAQLGPVKITGIASKQESEATTRSVPSTSAAAVDIRDIRARDYIRRTYFFLDDPNRLRTATLPALGITDVVNVPVRIDAANIRLFLDDLDGSNNTEQGAFPAYITPTGYEPCACPDAVEPCDDEFATLEDYPTYDVYELVEGQDYLVYQDGAFDFPGTVVELLRSVGDNELLSATFRTTDSGLGGLYSDVDSDDDSVGPDTIGTWDTEHQCGDLPTFRMIAAPLELLREADLSQGPWRYSHQLEAKNFYRLGGRNIDELDLEIRWDGSGATEATNFEGEPYLRILGLDTERLTGSTYEPGQDGEVDRRLLDTTDGILHFPQLRPFDPDSIDVMYRRNVYGVREEALEAAGAVRELDWPEIMLDGMGEVGNAPVPDIYDNKATVYGQASDVHVTRYQISGQYLSPISTIELNAFNIIEGSEKVTAGSRELARNSDYDIDYEFGIVTVKESANVQPNEQINVTFSYAPLFGTSSKTLAGMSASLRPEGGDYGFSSTWLYESQGNPERRVKLGEEPTRTVIGEFAGDYKTESTLLTDMLGRLPFYTPASRSQVNMSGAFGVSIPNPNTKRVAYIDDFDASRDGRDLNMSYSAWKPPAIPTEISLFADADERKGTMVWYAPRRGALQGDLNPRLEGSEEADDGARVLELWLLPNSETASGVALAPEDNWYGFTQVISRSGEDLSTAQFIDIWINDYRDPGVRASGTMYVDIGEISEDAVWWSTVPGVYQPPDGFGFGVLDTEDENGDGRLDESTQENEDIGLDQEEEGDGEDPVSDPHQDLWSIDDREETENDPTRNLQTFRYVNGTEFNNTLDTEDLNGDFRLNQLNNYFTYRVDLGTTDRELVVTSVYDDFPGAGPGSLDYWIASEPEALARENNGWRRIRIPLGEDFEYDRTGVPDYSQVKHVRIWFTGMPSSQKFPGVTVGPDEPAGGVPLQIASVEFIGNRWLTGGDEAPILNAAGEPATDAELADGQKFAVSAINNKDNGDVYEAAFDLERDSDSQGEEFEAYLSLDLLNFPAGHTGTAYRRFPQNQDYTNYETLEFFAQVGKPTTGTQALEFFMRFGSVDGRTYYEYRKRLTPQDNGGGWNLIELPITALSNLKQQMDPTQGFIKERQEDGSWLSVRGSPSFSRVRQITLGVTNVSGSFLPSASVWVNELRLDDVEKNPSTAGEFRFSSTLSDLGNLSFRWDRRDADFVQVGEVRGSGQTSSSLNTSGTINADRFAPRLNMRIPVTVSYSTNTTEPKFRTGDDIVFEGENRELNITRNVNRRIQASYRRTPSRSPWLKYTVDAFSGSVSHDVTKKQAPTRTDTTATTSGNLSYTFSTPRHTLIPLPLGMQIDYLPSNFNASTSVSRGSSVNWQRDGSALTEPLVLQNENDTESATFNWNTSYRILNKPNVNYTYRSSRDLLRRDAELLGVNVGLELTRNENLSANYSLTEISDETASAIPLGEPMAQVVNTFVAPLRPSVNWAGSFTGRALTSQAIFTSRDSTELIPVSVSNGSNTTTRATFPLRRFVRSIREAARGVGGDDGDEDDDRGRGDEAEIPDRPVRPGMEPGGHHTPDAAGGRRPGGGRRGANRSPPPDPDGDDDRRGGGRGGRGDDDHRAKGPSPFGINLQLGDLGGQFQTNRTSSHGLVAQMPSFPYQLGLTRDLSSDRINTNTSRESDTETWSVNTDLKIRNIRIAGKQSGASFDVKATYSKTESSTRSTNWTAVGESIFDVQPTLPSLTLSSGTTWPDVTVSASDLHEGIGFLERHFRRVTLSSHYTRKQDTSGNQDLPRRTEQVSTDWAPFLAVETTLKSGMRINLRANRGRSESVTNSTNRTINITERSSINLSLQHTINRKRRIKNPFGRGQRIVNTRIDLSANVSVDSRRSASANERGGYRETVTADSRNLSVSFQGGYNFTRSIHGSAELRYGENRNNKTLSATSRTLGITITASFQF